uniref:Uncharacterized protein n=1 Tax=Talaromyces marneffei PM1 TaxID=1077442 RepID=A0A093VEJ3_TALMA
MEDGFVMADRFGDFFHQYIESSAYLHPFFRTMIPITVLNPPLMSTKLVNATAWDDLNGPNPEISALTLFQRDIAENMLLDSIAEATSPNADMIKGFAGSVTPTLGYTPNNETWAMPQPTDFKLMTFQRGQAQFWEGRIGLSTIRLLSDFFQLVMTIHSVSTNIRLSSNPGGGLATTPPNPNTVAFPPR